MLQVTFQGEILLAEQGLCTTWLSPCFFLIFNLPPWSREMNLAFGFIFPNGIFYCTRTLIIQEELQPLKPFLQVPSQACFLHWNHLLQTQQHPALSRWAAESSCPYQKSCFWVYVVVYYLLTLNIPKLLSACSSHSLREIFLLLTKEKLATKISWAPIMCWAMLSASYIVSLNSHNKPGSEVLLSPFYTWETGHCACDKLTKHHTQLASREAKLLCSSHVLWKDAND